MKSYTESNSINNADNWLADLKKLFLGSSEFRMRTLSVGKKIDIVTLDTMVSDKKILDSVVTPLLQMGQVKDAEEIKSSVLFGAQVKIEPTFDAMVASFLNGHSIIFVEGDNICLSTDTRTDSSRAIVEPPTSVVLRGPREGFVEDFKTNLTLLRKRLKTPDFKVFNLHVGKYTNTEVAVCFIDSIADKANVNKIIQQLESIDIDGVVDSSYLSRYLDKPKTLFFNRVGEAEKPDVVVAKLLEGRIAIVVDGSPMVLTLPYLFIEDLQGPGDYHQPNEVSSIGRILRIISVVISVILPAMYVSLQNFNYQIIPIKFLITMLGATQSIPFSPLFEMLMVIIIFDVLREANLRMPTPVSMSLSLVGAIVLGEAAVAAGLLGAPAVVIGALSGVGLYTMPENTLVLSLLRLGFTFIGGTAGILGVVICSMALLGYMVSLQQLGSPFMSPYAPIIDGDLKEQDAILMSNILKQRKRPQSIKNTNPTRRGNNEK